MPTIFSCPKPFSGHFAVIQKNAIRSWTLLKPCPHIILIGNEPGTAEVCRELNLMHVPDVRRNEYGTPLMSSIFEIGQKDSKGLLVYINADIILMDDFVPAVQTLAQHFNQFVAVGHRWDVGIREDLKYSLGWEKEMRELTQKSGKRRHHCAMDCFVFPKGLADGFPDFALGRPMWDNWFIYKVQQRAVPVIDFTEVVYVVHQAHDYSHYKLEGGVWGGPEAKENLKLAGGYRHAYTIRDADYRLTKDGLERNYLKYLFKSLRAMKFIFHRYICQDQRW